MSQKTDVGNHRNSYIDDRQQISKQKSPQRHFSQDIRNRESRTPSDGAAQTGRRLTRPTRLPMRKDQQTGTQEDTRKGTQKHIQGKERTRNTKQD